MRRLGQRIVLALLALALGTAAARVEERVFFPSLDGDVAAGQPTTLTGILYRPVGEGPFPAVVGQHGCSGLRGPDGRLFGTFADWSRVLTQAGFVVLWVDSFTPRGASRVCRESPPEVAPHRARNRDAAGALMWLRDLPGVRRDRIALAGWSHGGASALATTGDLRDGTGLAATEGGFRATVAFYPGWCRARWMTGWRTTTPTLVLLGALDDWTPAEPCAEMMRAAQALASPVEFVIYPDAHHSFDAHFAPRPQTHAIGPRGIAPTSGANPAARADAHRRVVDFLKQHLAD